MRLCTALLACLALAACGGGASTPDEHVSAGYRALGSADYATAVKDFEAALDAIGADSSHPEFLSARMGWIEALTQTDAARARDEFLELARSLPSKITDREFTLVGSRLGEAGRLDEALDVLAAGIEAHPESPQLIALRDRLGDQAASAGSSEALKTLKGLGYLGD